MKSDAMIRMAVIWNDAVLSETMIDPKRGVTIGNHKRSDIRIPVEATLATDKYQLFAPSDADFGLLLNLSSNMHGWIEQGGARKTLPSASSAEVLQLGDRGLINLTEDSSLALFFYVTERHERVKRVPFGASDEPGFFAAIAVALIFHFGVLLSAFIFMNYDYSVSSTFMGVDRFTSETTVIDQREIEELIAEDDSVSKRAGGEEGKFGQEDKVEESKVSQSEGEVTDKLKSVGAMRVLNNLSGSSAISSMFNKNNFSDQLSAMAMGGAAGELVIGAGAGGMGMRGVGVGGGGDGFGRIHGVGNIDTGPGAGIKAKIKRGQQTRAKFKVRRGTPSVGNFCKQKDIIRVVSGRQRAIQYCYERELARNPELRGKVILNWLIGLDGKVMRAWVGSSALKNGSVESCIVRTIQRARFTKPNGGICQIKFPFVFNF